MRPSPGRAFWIVAICSALVLVAQVLGLHFHRHVEAQGPSAAHLAELHFESGGLHLGDLHAGEAHHEHAADGDAGHWHLDLESEALKAGFAKAFIDLPPLPLLWLVGLIGCAASTRAPRPARRVPVNRRSRALGLHPPPQAPPEPLVFA